MKYRFTFLLLLLTNLVYGYQDNDLDGIEDKFDKCPNTLFDTKVNQYGCAVPAANALKTQNTINTLIFSIGTTYQTDKIYDSDASMNFSANYRYKNLDFSLSNIRSMNKTNYYDNNSNTDNDIYLSVGYMFFIPETSFKLTGGTKIAENNDQNSDKRDNDYFASVFADHFISSKQDIFLYYGYTFSGDSSIYDYEDYSSFSIGSGYQFNRNYYSALSYNYTDSIYKDGTDEESLSWYNSYKLTKKIFITGTYSYAFQDLSYDNSFTLTLNVRF